MEFHYINKSNIITDDNIISDVLHIKNDILKKNYHFERILPIREIRQ